MTQTPRYTVQFQNRDAALLTVCRTDDRKFAEQAALTAFVNIDLLIKRAASFDDLENADPVIALYDNQVVHGSSMLLGLGAWREQTGELLSVADLPREDRPGFSETSPNGRCAYHDVDLNSYGSCPAWERETGLAVVQAAVANANGSAHKPAPVAATTDKPTYRKVCAHKGCTNVIESRIEAVVFCGRRDCAIQPVTRSGAGV